MAVITDITVASGRPIYRGEDVVIPFVMDPAPVGGIAGWTISMKVKKDEKYTNTTILITVAAVITNPGGPLVPATFTCTVLHAESLLPPKIYFYDVWRTDLGSQRVLAKGQFEIAKEVTY